MVSLTLIRWIVIYPVDSGIQLLNNRGQVSANRWLRGIKMYRFPWYLTLVSTNHASSDPGQVVSPSICKHQLYPSCRPSTKPPSPRLWADLCIPLLRSSERILIWCSCGTKAEFFGVGGKRGLFTFKGAVNLINLNIVDKPVKTL